MLNLQDFTFSPQEITLIKTRQSTKQLTFALMLKCYQHGYDYISNLTKIPKKILNKVAASLGVRPNLVKISARTYDDYLALIRKHLNISFSKKKHYQEVKEWIISVILPSKFLSHDEVKVLAVNYIKELGIEKFKDKTINRIIHEAFNTYERRLFQQLKTNIFPDQEALINGLLLTYKIGLSYIGWINKDFNKPCLESMINIAEQLSLVNQFDFNLSALKFLPRKRIRYYSAAFTRLSPSDLRNMSDGSRCAHVLMYLYLRKQELTDLLIDMFQYLIKNVIHKSEQRIVKKLVKEITKVYGKDTILVDIAETCLEQPKGIIEEHIFPIASEDKLRKIIEEYKKKGAKYQTILHEKVKSSYASYYRRMIMPFLQSVTFRCNNKYHQPILDGLELIKKYFSSKTTYIPDDEHVPTSFLPDKWKKRITDEKNGRIKRVSYEVYLLKKLADRIKCREIWIEESFKHRDPDEDLPSNFEENQEEYFNDLSLPMDADQFIETLKAKVKNALQRLNDNIPYNQKVKISDKNNGRIIVTPLTAQKESENTKQIKKHLQEKWKTTNLIDMLKEANLTLNFTEDFVSYGEKTYLKPNELSERLLLAIYGFGTNVGLKHISAGNEHISYHQLRHVKDYFLTADNLKNAIGKIANEIFKIRFPEVWGNTPLAVACDSTQFAAYIQNLISEYHNRYGGRGVMIYWHVEKNACCIHSQLKSVSTSEVSAMIEGVLRHCTEMSVEKSYVDTHGQSEVGFAFAHLLGFCLMPRLANLNKQRLAQCELGDYQKYENINAVFGDTINWQSIKEEYSQMVKYAAAMKEGHADPESVLRRFNKNNLIHPTYKALSQLGKVIKTIFICDYLIDESMRQEIQEGLNVVELWNGVSKFIFYGRTGEIASNNEKTQNLSVKSLHLVQLAMVYINTIMIQQILVEHNLIGKLTKEDKRAITPLIYEHVNPYGLFPLDLELRLPYLNYEVAA